MKLDIGCNRVGDEGAAALGRLLSSMITLKRLRMNIIGWVYGSGFGPDIITPQGWQAFFTAMQDSNLDLADLGLGSNSFDDEGLQLLVSLVSGMSAMKYLNLG